MLTYTVRATDSPSGGTGDKTVVITVTGTNDVPVISLGTGDSAAAGISETNATLTASDTLTITDLDYSNTVAATVPTVTVVSGRTNNIANLLSMLTVSPASPSKVIGSTATTGTLTWTFSSGSQYFDYLEKDETLVLDYTVLVLSLIHI